MYGIYRLDENKLKSEKKLLDRFYSALIMPNIKKLDQTARRYAFNDPHYIFTDLMDGEDAPCGVNGAGAKLTSQQNSTIHQARYTSDKTVVSQVLQQHCTPVSRSRSHQHPYSKGTKGNSRQFHRRKS